MGIDCTLSWPAIEGFSSMLILTRRTLPPCARTTFSRMGVSCLQGPHHGAQKSTSTGTLRDASSTSLAKVAAVAFLMMSPSAAVCAAAPGLPSPKTMSSVSCPLWAHAVRRRPRCGDRRLEP